MATAVINAKQGLTSVPTYAELIKELDKEKIKTNEIRKVFDRNVWYFHDSPLNTAPNETITEDTVFHRVDGDEMEELGDDAIDLYEKGFEKEAEMREEEDRTRNRSV